MTYKAVVLLLLYMPLCGNSQQKDKGIRFEQDHLTWEQIKTKAKNENKYIFIDCYATWCVPCKKMDNEVYANEAVGDLFNEKFVSVKLQMDKTNNDKEEVKKWYTDAEIVSKRYKVIGYPTFLFFSPDGEIVESKTGYMNAGDFMDLAEITLMPGKVYVNPYALYDSLVNEYKQGKKDYPNMIYMVKTSMETGENVLAGSIAKDYFDYLLGPGHADLLTRENIAFVTSTFSISSKSRLFHLFYPDGRRIDSVMNKKGYAQSVVDETIQREEVDSFTAKANLQMKDDAKKMIEPDWNQLYRKIKHKYNSAYAERNVLDAKAGWYRFKDPGIFIENYLKKVKKYGTDTTDMDQELRINDCAYVIFENSNDVKQIDIALKWMEGVVRRHPLEDSFIDTYASLLYKSGNQEAGLEWEEKALAIAKEKPADQINPTDIAFYESVIEKMKKREIIWPANQQIAK